MHRRPLVHKLLQDAALLLATIDPLGTLLLFGALTGDRPAAERAPLARRAVLFGGAILLAALVLGQFVLQALGVRLASLQIAGGVLLFLFGVRMVLGDLDAEARAEPEPGHDAAVFPLAIPSIASPGALIAVILLTDNYRYSPAQQAATGAVLVAILALTYAMMRAADPLLRFLGSSGARILIRVLGMILAALAVEMTLSGLGIAGWADSAGAA
jgi:multiple antibiotic resistance protein